MNETEIQIKLLMESILKMPGKKILTLTTEDKEPFTIDVSEDGDMGYNEKHGLLFKAKLFSAFNSAGVLIIRQFMPIKVKREMANGKKIWIPLKSVYGVYIAHGKWVPVSKSEMKWAHCTDYRTGKSIAPEEEVFFCDFPV